MTEKNLLDGLMDDYLKWYKDDTILSKIDEIQVISTPYTNHIGDRINLYVEKISDYDIRVSDDGETLNELSMVNYEFNSQTRQKHLNTIIYSNGLRIDKNTNSIYIEIIRKDFGKGKHKLIEGINKVYDLLFTKKENVKKMFLEDVLDFFKEEDFGGVSAVRKKGASGIDHGVDYILGVTSKRKETLMQAVNNSDFDSFARQYYIFDDILKLYMDEINYVVIINKPIPEKVQKALASSPLQIIQWTSKKRLLDFQG